MLRANVLFYSCFAAGFVCQLQPVSAQVYPVILHGTVQMKDGSPPEKSVGVERVCSDSQGFPGPLTNKKGEFIWRMDVDPMRSRKCSIHATATDWTSSEVDISSLNGVDKSVTLPPIILSPKVPDPSTVLVTDGSLPGKSKAAWKTGIAAAEQGDMVTAAKDLRTAAENSPKFVGFWHALGVIQARLPEGDADARKSFEQSIVVDPKFLPSYVMLARLQIKAKDWDGAAKTCESLLAVDKKGTYPEIYLHLAVARYQKKDLAGAETIVQEALTKKNDGKVPRAEYVLGRILAAKGDAAGAREHMGKYLKLEPDAEDKAAIEAFMLVVDKPGAVEPELEIVH